MPRLLKELVINDVSSVDRGAGEGVRVMLMKRHTPAEVAEHLKRAASNDAAALSLGAALPGKDKQDLTHKRDSNVIDMTGLLRKDAVDFDTAQEVQETREAAWSMMDELNEAICALSCSVNSIMCDESVVDKSAAVAESFNQFQSYISGLKPEDMEKAMPNELITKQITDAVAAAMKGTTEQITKLTAENAFLKLSPASQEFCKAFSDADKAAFIAKSDEDQAKDIEAAKKRATVELPADVVKRLADADANTVILKNLQEKDEVATFEKRAVALGFTADKGSIIRKAYGGDATAQAELDKLMGEMNKALVSARDTGKVFNEFGSLQGKIGKAYDAITAKADELRKTEAGKGLSEAQAFTKVYTDPANAALVEQHKTESAPAQRAA